MLDGQVCQVSQAPCSLRHSPEAKSSTTSARTTSRIHTPANNSHPMALHPGERHRDCLLYDHTAASALALDIVNLPDGDHAHTFVHPSHSFSSVLPFYRHLQQEEAGGVSNPDDSRPCYLIDAPRIASDLTGRACLYSLSDDRTPLTDKTNIPYPRILTNSSNVNRYIMTTTSTVPGSPPDLTDSRSSKSSSYGSQFSRVDELATEVTHFEEIGLEDEGDGPSSQPQGSIARPNKHVDAIKSPPYFTTRRSSMKELAQIKTDPPNDASMTGPRLKRGLTTISTMTLPEINQRPRSTSPPKRMPRSASSMSFGANSIASTSPRNSLVPFRRTSWQPRKSAAELEAEYDQSDDDDLPDDASLWNVPVSANSVGSRSARSSARGSPERTQSTSPQPMPLEHVRTHPDSPPGPRRAMTSQALVRHRLKPRSSTSNLSTSPVSPPMPGALARTGRAKSWNIAMASLSPEARILSQNLERHAESQDDTSSQSSLKDKWLPPIPYRSSAPGAIQLPPIQRGPLDFMPTSKEKEAILSRTRPSWLPPKDPKEEKKHLREYQKMMAASIEAEKKKQDQAKASSITQDDVHIRLNRIWQYYVEPTTDIVNIDKRVHDLCWRGISPRLRGKVWQRTLGNSLGLSSKAYQMALDRASEIKSKDPQDLGRQEQAILNSFADIERDAETAFPSMKIFQRKGPLWQELINVCEAHACYRGDVGYVYGVQLISALILLQVPDPAEAFIVLENCLNNPIPHAFQTSDEASIQRTYNRVIETLGLKFPRLHDHLFGAPEQGGLGMTGEEVLETMFKTMFANGLDIDRLCRVWDIWIFEGDRTLIRTAVAVLGSLQSQILDIEGDLHLKRRNVQEMLGWGPFNRKRNGGYWKLDVFGSEERFVNEIEFAGKLDYTGH